MFKTFCLSKKFASNTSYITSRLLQSGREINIPVPWGHIAAKEWGDEGGRPVLALHGMGDNLASFETLAPLLPRYWHVVALDFPGFGQSPPLPEGSFPGLITMVADAKRATRHLGWSKCDIIGHSFGGSVALLYAALFPDDVGRVVGLDPVKFLCGPAHLVRHLLAERIKDLLDLEASKANERFQLRPLEVAVQQTIIKRANSLTKESATLMVKRVIQMNKNGPSTNTTNEKPNDNSKIDSFYASDNFGSGDFKKNSRNKLHSNSTEESERNNNLIVSKMASNLVEPNDLQLVPIANTDWHKLIAFQEFTVDQGLALAQALSKTVDVLMIQSSWATPKWYTRLESFPFSDFVNVLGKHGRLRRVVVGGTHHVHMNQPEMVLPHIVEFLNEANIDFRSLKPSLH